MKKLIILAAILALTACNKNPTDPTVDQCLRVELFQSCLANLPDGPDSVKYNDWDEVVERCDTSAYYQSHRQRQYIKPSCLSGV